MYQISFFFSYIIQVALELLGLIWEVEPINEKKYIRLDCHDFRNHVVHFDSTTDENELKSILVQKVWIRVLCMRYISHVRFDRISRRNFERKDANIYLHLCK